MPHWLADLFGPGTWGTGVAIDGRLGDLRQHRGSDGGCTSKQKAQHLERMRQAERHHEEMKQHVADVAATRGESGER